MKTVISGLTRRHPDDPTSDAWLSDIKPHAATHFTAEMLRRTREPADPASAMWPSDHFALERMARDLRRDSIARVVYAGQLWISEGAGLLGARIRSGLRAVGAWGAPLARWVEGAIDDFDVRAGRWQRERREALLSQAS